MLSVTPGPPRERGVDMLRADGQSGHQVVLRLRELFREDRNEAVRQQHQEGTLCLQTDHKVHFHEPEVGLF